MTYSKCETCGMGSLGGEQWLAEHKCPDPYPQEVAQSMWDTLVIPGGAAMHPRTKARLQMSWPGTSSQGRSDASAKLCYVATREIEQVREALLSDAVVMAAWERVLDGIQPEDVLPDLRGQKRTREIIEAALDTLEHPVA